MAQNFVIRPAERKDCESIVNLIEELAEYEKLKEKAQLTAKDLERDGFDTTNPYFRCLVAEVPSDKEENKYDVIGYGLYYYTYSTWQGKAIHLEDFYVSPNYRKYGIGTAILKKLAKIAVKGDFCRLTLECLSWNEPTRKFYEKLNAVNYTEVQGWQTYRFVREVLEKLAADS